MTPRFTSRLFGELAEFRNGVNFSASSRGSGNLAVIGVGDFQANERLRTFSHLEKIARPTFIGDDALLKDGDLVFVRSNGNKALIGRCMLLGGIEGPVTHSGFTIRARITSGDVSPEWVCQYFATGLAKREIMRRGGGTNISNLSQRILQELPVPVPEADYQRRVLNVADAYSRTVRLLDAGLRSRRELKRGLMQQLLTGQRRFSEFPRSNERQAGQFGDVPKDWSVVHISEIAHEVKTRGETEGAVVYSCTKHEGLVPSLEYFGKQVFSRNLDGYKRLQAGDFGYATNHIEEGSIGLLREGRSPGLVSPMYTVFRATDRVDPEFLFALLKTESYRRVFESRTSASVNRRGSLRWKEFSRIKVGLPPIEEQNRIAGTLRLVDRELEQLAQLRKLVKVYKHALLSKLLSGETAVPS